MTDEDSGTGSTPDSAPRAGETPDPEASEFGAESSDPEPPDPDVPPVEVLLHELERANDELRLWLKSQRQLLTSGIAASGFLMGYAFMSTNQRYSLIALVPAIVAIVAFLVIDSAINGLYLSAHSHRIESDIRSQYGDELSAFGWEHEYGGLVDNGRSVAGTEFLWGLSLPQLLTWVLAVLTYSVLVGLALWAIERSELLPDSLPFLLAFLLGYLSLGAMAAFAGRSHRDTKTSLRADCASYDSPED